MKEVEGVGERVSATDADGSIKPRQGMLMPVLHGAFWPVLAVNVQYSEGVHWVSQTLGRFCKELSFYNGSCLSVSTVLV